MPGAIETDLTIAYNHSFALSAGALDVRATYVTSPVHMQISLTL